MSPLRRVGVPAAGLLAVAAVIGLLLRRFFTDPTFLPPLDFLQYWAAGRLLATGGDPYDADALAALQASNGTLESAAVVNWQPPWNLAVCLPFGALPARLAQLVWLTIQVVLITWACLKLWRVYGGPAERSFLVVGLGMTFPPTMFLLHEGQSGGWLLAGLTGWLLAAGGPVGWAALLALCGLKPHLFAPLGVALVLHAVRHRPTAVRLGVAVAVGLLATVAVTAVRPTVWDDYRAAVARPASEHHRPLTHWHPPVVGYWLRSTVAPDQFWIQFVPCGLGCLATVAYYWSRRHGWDWRRETPGLVAAGAFVAPYSGWVFDLVILLVPITATAAHLARTTTRRQVGWVLAGMLVVWLPMAALGWREGDGSAFVWVTPAVAVGCWLIGRIIPSAVPGGEG